MKLKIYLVLIIILIVACWLVAADSSSGIKLTLQDCLQRALKENLNLRIQILEHQKSIRQVTGNRAQFVPDFSLDFFKSQTVSPSASLLEGADVTEGESDILGVEINQNLPLGGQLALYFGESRYETNSTFYNLNPRFDARLQVEVTQPLLQGFGDRVARRDILLAVNEQNAVYQDLRETVMETLVRVENAYWDLVYRRMALEVRKESVRAARRLLEINEKKLKSGTIPELEILTAESQVASRESDLIQAEADIREAEDVLRQILNMELSASMTEPGIVPIDRPEDIPAFEPPSLPEVLESVRRQDPQLRRLEYELKNRGLDVRYYKNRLLPRLDLIGSLWTTGLSGDEIIFDDSDYFNRIPVDIIQRDMWLSIRDALQAIYSNWSVRLNLSLPLFNAPARGDLEGARLAFTQARLTLWETQNAVVSSIRMALRDFQTSRKKLTAFAAARRLAGSQLAAEEKKFRAGLSTNYEVIKAQENYEENQFAELEARIDLNKSIIRFQKETGLLLQKKGIILVPEDRVITPPRGRGNQAEPPYWLSKR